MVEKYVQDGMVGVLYSPGFGAGWSTWGEPEMAYDRDLVDAFIIGGHDALTYITQKKYPNAYQGGLTDVTLGWVKQGTGFRIHEYDGSESLEIQSDDSFTIA